MTVPMFLALLFGFSVITGLIVEAIKNIIVVALNKNKLSRYDKNIAFVSCGAVLIILFRMITASTLSVTNYYLVSYVILNFVIYTVIKERRL